MGVISNKTLGSTYGLVCLQTQSFLSFSHFFSQVHNLVQLIMIDKLCPLVEKIVVKQ